LTRVYITFLLPQAWPGAHRLAPLQDEERRPQFEALTSFRPEEKKVAKAVLESLILKHEANRWAKAGGEG
jgi:hypothetical protein